CLKIGSRKRIDRPLSGNRAPPAWIAENLWSQAVKRVICTPRDPMKLRIVISVSLLTALLAHGQVLLQGERPVRLLPSDATILDGGELRNDLPCNLKPVRPELGFDLAFHGGYELSVPVQDLSGGGNALTAIFRVIPESSPEQAAYFSQTWTF